MGGEAALSGAAGAIAPVCPHFGICGACQFQDVPPDLYRARKREAVVRALASAGVEAEVGALIDANGEGRRRVTFALKRSEEQHV